MSVSLNEILEARGRIQSVVIRTPVSESKSCSDILKTQTFLKMENQQRTGSFKIRGSLNKMLRISKEDLARGVVASSAGNHAQGVAFSAKHVGAKAKVVMPENSPLVKILATQDYGAEVILKGQVYDESYQYAKELEKEFGYTFVHPYNDPDVIAGQGTIGLELIEDLPDLESVIIPIGGGGLISGVATALKAIKPDIKIFGVVSDAAPGMKQLYQGQKVNVPSGQLTIADGIAVKTPSENILKDYISKYVDGVASVNDDEIAESIVFFLERSKTVVEGSGAVVLAAAKKEGWDLGKSCALLLSGGNIDLNMISKVIERGLRQKGRLARFTVVVPDRPGALNRLTQVIAGQGANIVEVNHDRVRAGLLVSETAIDFLLETRSEEHSMKLMEALKAAGVKKVFLNGGS